LLVDDQDGTGAALRSETAVADVDRAGARFGDCRVVRDDQRGGVDLGRELEHQLDDGRGRLGIELSRGLVGEQEPRPLRQCRADGDALLLAAGELVRAGAGAVFEAGRTQERADAVGVSGAEESQREPDDLVNGQLPREGRMVVLADDSDRAPPETGDLGGG